jgi:hypothetical protein
LRSARDGAGHLHLQATTTTGLLKQNLILKNEMCPLMPK